MKRLLLFLLVLGAGCRLEAPLESPSAPEAGERSADVRAAPPDPMEAPARPSVPAPPPTSNPTPRVPPASVRSELVVTIGRETLRLDAEAVLAVEKREDPYMGPAIVLVLRDGAAESFARMTGANRGKQAVVTLDGRVLTSLAIMERIVGGRLPIPIEASEASDLEIQIRAATGTLPTI